MKSQNTTSVDNFITDYNIAIVLIWFRFQSSDRIVMLQGTSVSNIVTGLI
jgi:hypothetical protein